MADDRLHLIVKECAPPDDFRYTFPEDGHRVKSSHYHGWLRLIKKHYQQNEYPLPADWAELAEDQLCRLLPPGCCQYSDGSDPEFHMRMRFDINDVINGTKVLGGWKLAGMPLVPKEEAEARGAICAACYANVQVPGCGPCVGFANLVADVAGAVPLESDLQLEGRSCGYCHCSSRANVWVPLEISRHGVTQDALDAMPQHCWKKKGIAELAAK